jgi:sigma-B regulation protein RsbU (phosphoserine phosphatase)
MKNLNMALSREKMQGMFVTFLYGILDPSSGMIQMANAGHLPPVFRRNDGSVQCLGAASGPPLGMLAVTQYRDEEVRLNPSDTLLFYSDGILEAKDRFGQQFESERLFNSASQSRPGAKGLLSAVLDAVEEFSRGAAQADDMTLVATSWRG